jgi:hypothetical protein
MSVIVYRDGVMAADTADWIGELAYSFDVEKIKRLPDGSLVGACGESADCQEFFDWAQHTHCQGAPPKPNDEGFAGIQVRLDGAIWRYQNGKREKAHGDWDSLGAHYEFVHGLMVAGMDAVTAVETAIKHCAFAAGRVYALKLQAAPAEEETAPEEADEVLDDIYINDPDHDPVGPRRDPFLVERGLE